MQFKKFLEVMRKVLINFPFVEVISHMSSYAKHLKEILSNKGKLENVVTMGLNEECSTVVLRKLPPKMKDPAKFTIPCLIRGLTLISVYVIWGLVYVGSSGLRIIKKGGLN